MGRLHDSVLAAGEAMTEVPVQCPRGWGKIAFLPSGSRWFICENIKWQCPIGGVSQCVDCRHHVNPLNTELLHKQLDELHLLQKQGVVSEEEAAVRRRAMIEAAGGKASKLPGAFRILAWLIGPFSLVMLVTGLLLAVFLHPGFFGLAGGGAAVLALAISFAALSRPYDTRPTKQRHESDRWLEVSKA